MNIKKLNRKNIYNHLIIYIIICFLAIVGIYLIVSVMDSRTTSEILKENGLNIVVGIFLLSLWVSYTIGYLKKPKSEKFVLKQVTEYDTAYRLLFYNQKYGNASYYTRSKDFEINEIYTVKYKRINNHIYRVIK